jgi:hypothetical protein
MEHSLRHARADGDPLKPTAHIIGAELALKPAFISMIHF